MSLRFLLLTVAIGLIVAQSVWADENVREVQEKLRDDGFYSGQIDGAYSSELSAALTRYQVRKGLPISGQLDAETSKALGAKPAVGPSTAGSEQSSETWRRLRKGQQRTSTRERRSQTAATETRERSSPADDETPETATQTQPRSAAAVKAGRIASETTEPPSSARTEAPTSSEATERSSSPLAARSLSNTTEPASAPATGARTTSQTTEAESAPPATASADDFNPERLRDYVAAFVLAGLDRNVGAETEFFADRVQYYDQGIMDREKIRQDLKRYDERWPERHFWVAGSINIEPQNDERLQVTFPLGFKLRNGNKQLSGKVEKTLVLERAGDDLQIVAVNEREKK